MNSKLVISLDFELFWGMIDTSNLNEYQSNIEGVWEAIPQILKLFKKFNISATWATVGMLMCKNYNHWQEMRLNQSQLYSNDILSMDRINQLIKNNEKLFFARDLVQLIQDYEDQEIASHTFSHLHCKENNITRELFMEDLKRSIHIGKDLDIFYKSIVFPRNQVNENFFDLLKSSGFISFRGNLNKFLYKNGHKAPAGIIGKAIRFTDSWLPITNELSFEVTEVSNLINIPGSIFLRPFNYKLQVFDKLKIGRIKKQMLKAAKNKKNIHLWWHPHNFGTNLVANLATLKEILEYYRYLHDNYNMKSSNMMNFKD